MRNDLEVMRKARGYTMKQLAIRADVVESTICTLEKKGQIPMLTTAYQIAAALKCDVNTIWPGEENENI